MRFHHGCLLCRYFLMKVRNHPCEEFQAHYYGKSLQYCSSQYLSSQWCFYADIFSKLSVATLNDRGGWDELEACTFSISLIAFHIRKRQLSHCILSYFDHRQNYLEIEENLKIILYRDRKTPKR